MIRMATITGVLSIAVLLVAGCGTATLSPHRHTGVILADASGICPTREVYTNLPPQCSYAHAWNGTTPSFTTPHRQWGVAYAFNCGARARDFSFVERLPGMDHMALPSTYRHARQGSGYTMISRRTMIELLREVPVPFKVDGALMEVNVASACTWHVKAILGSKGDVASAVPPIPAMRSRWWT